MDVIRTEKKKPLENLHIAENDLQEVAPDSLAEAVVSLKFVSLQDTNLFPEHCQRLIDVIRTDKEKTLENLDIGKNDLKEVASDSLAEAVVSLKTASLQDTNMVPEPVSYTHLTLPTNREV